MEADFQEELKPILSSTEYIFISIKEKDFQDYLRLKPISIFYEKEGISLIIERKKADENNIEYSSVFKMITISLYTDLNSVGIISEISRRLADAGISVNPVAAFYHDHLFVPSSKAEEAMKILSKRFK